MRRAMGIAAMVMVAVLIVRADEEAGDRGDPPAPEFPGVELFNGKDLTGWQVIEGDVADWTVVDGVLTCSGNRHGWLGTAKQYDNFRLYVEFRVPAGGNSGVFLRAPDEGNPAFTGLEVQVLDDRAPQYANLPNHSWCGGLYDLEGPKERATRAAGQWQTLDIECTFGRVKVTLNGVAVVDAELKRFADRKQQHPGVERETGRIGLQSWGTKVEFRRVRVQHFGRAA